jgi:pterin-4a-carbinolamine dehydratase
MEHSHIDLGTSNGRRGGAPKGVTMVTTDAELFRVLRDLPGWQRHGDSIEKTFQFDDFAVATRFVGRVALDAAAAGREPPSTSAAAASP